MRAGNRLRHGAHAHRWNCGVADDDADRRYDCTSRHRPRRTRRIRVMPACGRQRGNRHAASQVALALIPAHPTGRAVEPRGVGIALQCAVHPSAATAFAPRGAGRRAAFRCRLRRQPDRLDARGEQLAYRRPATPPAIHGGASAKRGDLVGQLALVAVHRLFRNSTTSTNRARSAIGMDGETDRRAEVLIDRHTIEVAKATLSMAVVMGTSPSVADHASASLRRHGGGHGFCSEDGSVGRNVMVLPQEEVGDIEQGLPPMAVADPAARVAADPVVLGKPARSSEIPKRLATSPWGTWQLRRSWPPRPPDPRDRRPERSRMAAIRALPRAPGRRR